MPQWDNTGTEPSAAKKTAGWIFNEKPPAEWFNWLFHRTYKCIEEIRTVVSNLCYQVGDVKLVPYSTPDTGWLKANGAAISIATYSALATKIYCGDANNATADWGYKCTNPANPTGTRSTSGTYIVLPDYRGRHFRCWADDGSIDSGRNLWAYQLDDNKAHTHTASTSSDGAHTHTVTGSDSTWGISTGNPSNPSQVQDTGTFTTSSNGAHTHTVTVNSTGTTEVKVKNAAMLACIKY